MLEAGRVLAAVSPRSFGLREIKGIETTISFALNDHGIVKVGRDLGRCLVWPAQRRDISGVRLGCSGLCSVHVSCISRIQCLFNVSTSTSFSELVCFLALFPCPGFR